MVILVIQGRVTLVYCLRQQKNMNHQEISSKCNDFLKNCNSVSNFNPAERNSRNSFNSRNSRNSSPAKSNSSRDYNDKFNHLKSRVCNVLSKYAEITSIIKKN